MISFQPCVFGLGMLHDRDGGVGVFPGGEEIFVGSEGTDAGSIGIGALRGSRLQGVGTSYAQMRQCSRPAVPNDAAVVENFLKLGSGRTALTRWEVCLSAYVRRIEAGNVVGEGHLPQLDRLIGPAVPSVRKRDFFYPAPIVHESLAPRVIGFACPAESVSLSLELPIRHASYRPPKANASAISMLAPGLSEASFTSGGFCSVNRPIVTSPKRGAKRLKRQVDWLVNGFSCEAAPRLLPNSASCRAVPPCPSGVESTPLSSVQNALTLCRNLQVLCHEDVRITESTEKTTMEQCLSR